MERTPLQGGRLKSGTYDPKTRELNIEFAGGDVKLFKNVPAHVWRRLQTAQNPASFYEDRIEEEYAVTPGERVLENDTRKQLDDLFSKPKS